MTTKDEFPTLRLPKRSIWGGYIIQRIGRGKRAYYWIGKSDDEYVMSLTVAEATKVAEFIVGGKHLYLNLFGCDRLVPTDKPGVMTNCSNKAVWRHPNGMLRYCAEHAVHDDPCDKCLGLGCYECHGSGQDTTDPDPYEPKCCLCGAWHYGGGCQ